VTDGLVCVTIFLILEEDGTNTQMSASRRARSPRVYLIKIWRCQIGYSDNTVPQSRTLHQRKDAIFTAAHQTNGFHSCYREMHFEKGFSLSAFVGGDCRVA